jgi:DNA-binding CsgD family transcriptional regulator
MHDVQLTYDTEDLTRRERLLAEADLATTRVGDADVADEYTRLIRRAVWLLEGNWDALAGGVAAQDAEKRSELTAPLQSAPSVEPILVAAWRGDTARAWSLIRTHLPHGPTTEPGDSFYTYCREVQRAAATLALDRADPATAREWLDAHDRWLAWGDARSVQGRAEAHTLWGYYFRQVGHAMEARRRAERALAAATTPRQPLALIAAHRLLGELAADAGRYGDAATHLAESLAFAVACAAPFERALTLLAIATLHAATGNGAEASAALAEVCAICTPLGARPTLDRSTALAARLATMEDTPPAYPARLSAREVEVLRLVADGLTNAQVAERLFLSPHTINRHLTTIYAKLDVPSRAAAIRFALDHGLH